MYATNAAHAPARPRTTAPATQAPRPPSADERAALIGLADRVRESGQAAEQWGALPEKERRLLAAYCGLRELNPGEPLASIAARTWGEFSTAERAALSQGTRFLLSQFFFLVTRANKLNLLSSFSRLKFVLF